MHFSRLWIALLTLCCLAMSTSLAQDDATEPDPTSLDGRGYGLYVPSTYDENGDETLPLVIALHGAGDTWRNFFPLSGLVDRAEADNFIVAFPQGYISQWNDGSVGDHYEDDVSILLQLIERVDRDYRVDLDRVYLVGFSNGGSMVLRAACDAPGVFAGVAAVAGLMREVFADSCPPEAAVPVLIIHGTADTVVPFGGTQVSFAAPIGVAWWVRHNECNTEGVPFYDESLFNNGFATYFFEDCVGGNLVMFYALQDVPHTWPGAVSYINDEEPEPRYDTARIVWGFFDIANSARQDAANNPEVTPEATEASD